MLGQGCCPSISKPFSMKKILTYSLLFFSPVFLFSQKNDHIWVTGYSSNDIDTNWGGTIIDFNFDPPQLRYQYMDMNFLEYNAIASDGQGILQFYTNGLYIANKDQGPMENGLGLNPGMYNDNMGDDGYILPQGGIIVPQPGNSHQYYLIHADAAYPNQEIQYHTEHLYFSKIDMLYSNGLGRVTVILGLKKDLC